MYEPMKNGREGFDAIGGPWGYILDDTSAETAWRGLVPVAERAFSWPYRLHLLHGHDQYGAARLAPDWCFYSWRNEYVLASWKPANGPVVRCTTTLERRYGPLGQASDWPANPFAGEGNDRWTFYEWRLTVTLDLLRETWQLNISPAGPVAKRAPGLPGDVQAEGEAKAAKLLAFFKAECARWQAGETARPQQAYDLADHDS